MVLLGVVEVAGGTTRGVGGVLVVLLGLVGGCWWYYKGVVGAEVYN